MIYILHGDDTTGSRKRLGEICEGTPTKTFDGKSLLLKDLEESVLSTGLFEEEKAVVIENITRSPKKKEILAYLSTEKSSFPIVLWEDRKALKTSFSSLKNVKVEQFLLPSFYFRFLDTLSPRNKKESFNLYHELLQTYAPEQVFYSLLKRTRQLVVISSGARTEEIEKMSSWQLSNLKRQLQMWSRQSLLSFYESLKQTEIKLKTGALPVSLAKHLDIVLLSKLT